MSAGRARRRDRAVLQQPAGAVRALRHRAQAASMRGMTLLELLVALSIFALVGGALMPVINGAMQSRSAATRRAGLDAEARHILDRLEQDIAGNGESGFPTALPPRFVATANSTRSMRGERMLLETTTTVARGVTPSDAFVSGEDVAALTADRGDQAQVLWRIDSEGRLLRQELRPPSTQPVDWAAVPVEVMSERADLLLEFYELPGWLESWDSTEAGPHRNKAPAAVRSTLTIEEDDPKAEPFEIVSTVVVPVVEKYQPPQNPGGGDGRKDGGNGKGDKNDGGGVAK